MTETELNKQPATVRLHFAQIGDADLPETAEIRDRLARVAEAKDQHAQKVAAYQRLQEVQQRANQLAATLRAQAEQLQADRPAQIAEMLIAGEDIGEDEKTLAHLETIVHRIAALELAAPVLAKKMSVALADTVNAADRVSSADADLRQRRDEQRLAEARRRAF